MRTRHHIHGGGGLVSQPRRYEISSAIVFGGRRRRIYDGLVELSGAAAGDRVLDVGCGPGYLTRRVARVVGADGRVEGIDPAAEVIAYARRTAPSNATFTVAAAEDLPHANDSFDVVVSSLALHHVDADQRATALAEMRRVLRSDGTLLIAEIRPPRSRLGRKLRAGHGAGAGRDLADQLPDLLADAGFRVTGRGDAKHLIGYVRATPMG